MTSFNIVPAADRASRIGQAPQLRTYRIPGKTEDFPVKQVPLGMPVYRLANMRTSVVQRAYVRDNARPTAFFSAGQEDPEAQQVQHQILLDIAKDTRKDIYGKLAEIAEQTEPLILTEAGVVLNGNRRLAAMRALFAGDSARFWRFEQVEVVILPRSDESTLSALETDLQIAEDLRLPYGWVEEALGLRHQTQDLGWSLAQASTHWGKRTNQLTALLNQLALAEQYLDHIDQPLRYEQVEGDQQAFETLQQRLAAHQADGADPSRIEAEKLVMFSVLLHSKDGTIEGRTYDYASKIEEITNRVITDVTATDLSITPGAEEFIGRTPEGGEPGEPSDTDAAADAFADPLAELPEATAAVPESVLEAMRDLARSGEVARAADQARDDIGTEARRDRRGNALVRNAQAVHANAVSLSLTNADPATLAIAVVQLVGALSPIVDCLTAIVREQPDLVDTVDAEALAEVRDALSAVVAVTNPE